MINPNTHISATPCVDHSQTHPTPYSHGVFFTNVTQCCWTLLLHCDRASISHVGDADIKTKPPLQTTKTLEQPEREYVLTFCTGNSTLFARCIERNIRMNMETPWLCFLCTPYTDIPRPPKIVCACWGGCISRGREKWAHLCLNLMWEKYYLCRQCRIMEKSRQGNNDWEIFNES